MHTVIVSVPMDDIFVIFVRAFVMLCCSAVSACVSMHVGTYLFHAACCMECNMLLQASVRERDGKLSP